MLQDDIAEHARAVPDGEPDAAPAAEAASGEHAAAEADAPTPVLRLKLPTAVDAAATGQSAGLPDDLSCEHSVAVMARGG